MNFTGLIIVAAGLFSLCAAALDWNLFMQSRKAQWIVGIFGRNGARVFYGILGLGLMVLGGLIAAGILVNRR